MLHRGLRVGIELPQRLDLVAEKLDAHRQRLLPRKHIDNPAAHGELSALAHLRHAVVAGGVELRDQFLRIHPRATRELHADLLQRARSRHVVVKTRAGEDDDRTRNAERGTRNFFSVLRTLCLFIPSFEFRVPQSLQNLQPFRRDLGIGLRAERGGKFHLWKKERVGLPVKQLVVEKFLRADVFAHDPDAPRHGTCDQPGDEWPRGFRDVLEHDRHDAVADRAQPGGDRLRARDAVGQVG